jgi:hypothetical protein
MELLLALKRTLRHVGVLTTGDAIRPTTPKDVTYLQGREGPKLCSIVNLSRHTILPSLDITQRTGFGLVFCL